MVDLCGKEDSKQYPCRILAGNRVAIPKPIFDSLGWKDGDYVLVKSDGHLMKITGVEFIERR